MPGPTVRDMSDRTDELRTAHDVLAEFYVEHLADALAHSPVDRAVLGLFASSVATFRPGGAVGDIGCGTGRLGPFLDRAGLVPRGVDLSPGMIRAARRDHPLFEHRVADLRSLPFADAELAGALCWYSLMYLPPSDLSAAFAELSRVVEPGGYFATAFKTGDDELRRGGRSTGLGVEFDLWFLSTGEMDRLVTEAGFTPVFWAGRPPDESESTPQGFLIAQKPLPSGP